MAGVLGCCQEYPGMALTPEQRRQIYEEEKAREEARLNIAHQRQYGGFFGKINLGVTVIAASIQIVLGLIVLIVVGWLIWATLSK